MIQHQQNEQLIKIGTWVSHRLKKYEKILVIVFFTSLILKITSDMNLNILIVLTLQSLAILYFFKAFSVLENKNAGGIEMFLDKLFSMSASMGVIGILFRLQNWKGYEIMIMTGCVTLSIVIPFIWSIKSRKPNLEIFDNRMIFRGIIIVIIGLVLNFSSSENLVKSNIIEVPKETTE